MKIAKYFAPILIKFGLIHRFFTEVQNTQFYGNQSSGSRDDRRTDMTKVIGIFRDYAKAPKAPFVGLKSDKGGHGGENVRPAKIM